MNMEIAMAFLAWLVGCVFVYLILEYKGEEKTTNE